MLRDRKGAVVGIRQNRAIFPVGSDFQAGGGESKNSVGPMFMWVIWIAF